jgi:hypothetical protein
MAHTLGILAAGILVVFLLYMAWFYMGSRPDTEKLAEQIRKTFGGALTYTKNQLIFAYESLVLLPLKVMAAFTLIGVTLVAWGQLWDGFDLTSSGEDSDFWATFTLWSLVVSVVLLVIAFIGRRVSITYTPPRAPGATADPEPVTIKYQRASMFILMGVMFLSLLTVGIGIFGTGIVHHDRVMTMLGSLLALASIGVFTLSAVIVATILKLVVSGTEYSIWRVALITAGAMARGEDALPGAAEVALALKELRPNIADEDKFIPSVARTARQVVAWISPLIVMGVLWPDPAVFFYSSLVAYLITFLIWGFVFAAAGVDTTERVRKSAIVLEWLTYVSLGILLITALVVKFIPYGQEKLDRIFHALQRICGSSFDRTGTNLEKAAEVMEDQSVSLTSWAIMPTWGAILAGLLAGMAVWYLLMELPSDKQNRFTKLLGYGFGVFTLICFLNVLVRAAQVDSVFGSWSTASSQPVSRPRVVVVPQPVIVTPQDADEGREELAARPKGLQRLCDRGRYCTHPSP